MKTLTFIIAACLLRIDAAFAQPYKYYGGNLHAHTGYSDGNKDAAKTHVATPEGSYKFARESENFDFLGISEHNHSQAKMKLGNYAKGLAEADKANSATFVCMYGMEYGVIKNGGHVLIYGMDKLIGWEDGNNDIEVAKSDYDALWDILADHSAAFATLAHPLKPDFQKLLTRPYNKTADKVICGVAVMTGPAFSTSNDYDEKPAKKFIDYFRGLLAAGYHVGPTVDHDNHNLTFGRMATSRTMVLSEKLSREDISAAYRQMRFYATTDWNAKVSFVINGFPMGKQMNTKTAANIKVSVTDPDASDKVSLIKLMYGEPGSKKLSTLLTKTNDKELTFTDDLPKGEERYYYLEITQADKDVIYTAPIWVHRLK